MTRGEIMLLLFIVLALDWALEAWRRPQSMPPPSRFIDASAEDKAEPEVDDWHIADLAEAHRAAHASGCREACDRIERVLEDIEPGWRAWA
jgi:hypothetical protein